MEKNSGNLSNISDLFKNKTLKYRIDGFAEACNMKNIGVVRNDGVLFNTKTKTDDIKYYMAVNTCSNYQLGSGITISGYYGDLNFSFTNFRNLVEDLDRKIIELPFILSLFKKVDLDTYHLEIETVNGIETKFIITKSYEDKNKIIHSRLSFYANVTDFSIILKLVKSFVYNPQLVFATYNTIKEQKKIIFSGSELNKAIMQDENLDKPVGKIKKLIKNVIGN